LIVGDGTSLLVDTLFDLALTKEMLDAFAGRTDAAPIETVVNTHANGDHCYGNELVAGAEIIASTACAEEMGEVAPAMLAGLNSAPGDVGELFRSFFGDFTFDGITLTPPTRTFDGRLTVDVGGRDVELIEVGPAHTKGDVIVHVPDAKAVFTGDILFIGGTPIVWAGPLANWVAACDLMLGMDVDVVVPGHGPLTDKAGVAAVRDYLAFVDSEATARHDAGIDAWEAAKEIAALIGAGEDFGSWGEAGRIAVNVETVYRTLDPTHRSPDVVEQFRRMAALER
jgi:glyoxylase-like metal-dependent hydrolase (beta-lactamase superfamily II)